MLDQLSQLLSKNVKDRSKIKLVGKYLLVVATIASVGSLHRNSFTYLQEKFLEEIVTVDEGRMLSSLITFVYDAVKIPERKQAVKALFHIAESGLCEWVVRSNSESVDTIFNP
jgi:hypothetical protein